jgi:hypothetical protein
MDISYPPNTLKEISFSAYCWVKSRSHCGSWTYPSSTQHSIVDYIPQVIDRFPLINEELIVGISRYPF